MATPKQRNYALFLGLSIAFGLVFAVLPLTQDFSYLRPELLCLLVIFWVMNSPEQLGMTFGFLVGLLQDVVELGVWGGHAMALTIIAYICLMSYQRIRSYSVWHQSLWVFILVGVHQVVVNWVQGIAGYRTPAHYLVLPTLMTALCWPLVVFFFLRIRHLYRTQ
ncbi:rod shape-determining protein MreD [Teredinibacter turnerae]|uniref:Rod shape-determining protein MreD n=1 Tax=Teredinibacter turnerae (strain ATCC 39867 / T7901) TaxID=377629 RepID=C5BSY4_TERTT|nr:rod shape-determining protein MreD [Teredinibacter turnerae]ACR12378.1 rod shape-determining protein MreD [Teredinibacter turnerae T7901]